MKKGLFIVLDGNDGSGKATQSVRLRDYLIEQGIPTRRVEFPAYKTNFFGRLLGECLVGDHGDFLNLDPKITSSLYALDRQESAQEIREMLDAGTVVIADRFTSSNQIHQGGKIKDEMEQVAFLSWLDEMEHTVLNIPRPDTILYLRVPVDISLELLQKKRALKNEALPEGSKDVVESDRTYLEQSRTAADYLSRTQSNWVVIECAKDNEMLSIESIHEEVRAAVTKLIPVLGK